LREGRESSSLVVVRKRYQVGKLPLKGIEKAVKKAEGTSRSEKNEERRIKGGGREITLHSSEKK